MKKVVAIILFFLIDIAAGYILYTKAWIRFYRKNVPPVQAIKPSQSAQKAVPIKTYSNSDINLSFDYPINLQLTTERTHLISLKDPSSTSSDSSLLIFETTTSLTAKTVDIPFLIKGTLTKQTPIPVHEFTAKQLVYNDGTIFLTLRKDKQFIMVRIPKNSKDVEQAITEFVDTVKPLK